MTTAPPVNEDPADALLFGDSLDCSLVLPVHVARSDGPGRQTQAVTLLHGLAQIEDLRKEEGVEEHGDLPLLAQRMDAKLDLILALVGRLAMRADGLPERPLRWSAAGLRVDLESAVALEPEAGVLVRLQPAEWIPDHLELPARVIARQPIDGGTRLWLAFVGLRADLVEALDRHLFRLHRREVAEQRRR
ncbi:PilZ domain-containing protein [Luteimonas deserti]|uniref:PilZ domain-containing protein n=1 Tax=Luteimonas deserti TaxID=2752306 RepID=A0A7Z0TZU3_9GAMM|nr:PilZ domain-containing protein [Luteimonas deserti]NYZ64355.1 PilZ domain-containing protein [Luteimonas deserti]